MPTFALDVMRTALSGPQFSYITHNDRERIVTELSDAIAAHLYGIMANPIIPTDEEASTIDEAEKELLALRVIVQHMADLAGGGSELGIDDALQFLSDALDLGFEVNQGMVSTKEALDVEQLAGLGFVAESTPATAPTPDPATPVPTDPIAPPDDPTTHSPAPTAVARDSDGFPLSVG